MKAIVNEKDKSNIKYPYLMIADIGTIVLFCERGCGICLKAGTGDEFLEYSSDWDMSRYEPFNGTITLSNE